MIYVYRLRLWARPVGSIGWSWREHNLFAQGEHLSDAILPLYETIEHITVIHSEIICEIDVDNPLGLL